MHPEAYLHYILPRLRGDPEVVAFGTDTATRVTVMEVLQVRIDTPYLGLYLAPTCPLPSPYLTVMEVLQVRIDTPFLGPYQAPT